MEQVFISYRSTSYKKLNESGCAVIKNGKKCDCQTAPSCPVQDCAFKRAAIFANKQDNYKCYIVPPVYMLPPNTLLTPIDFYQHLPLLSNNISQSDIFVRFELEEDSFWTYLEYELWRRRSIDLPENNFYTVWLDAYGKTNFKGYTFDNMSKNDARLYWRLLYYTSPDHYHDHEWGRYSNCFISICPNCGEITLYSLAALKYMIKHNIRIKCTHCRNASFSFQFKSHWRNIITYDYHGEIKPTPSLSNEFVISLLLDSNKEILNHIHLICMSYESFPKVYALNAMMSILKDQMKKQFMETNLELRTYKDGKILRMKL